MQARGAATAVLQQPAPGVVAAMASCWAAFQFDAQPHLELRHTVCPRGGQELAAARATRPRWRCAPFIFIPAPVRALRRALRVCCAGGGEHVPGSPSSARSRCVLS